jgi:hypothetical protein
MKKFLDSLIADMRALKKQKDTEDALSLAVALLFMKRFNDEYIEKQNKYKEDQSRRVG